MSFARIVLAACLVLSSSGAFAASFAGPRVGELECRQVDRDWHVWSKLYGHEVGHSRGRGGFPNKDSCQWAIDVGMRAGQDIVCGWNEVGFAPIHLPTNRVVGEADIAWRFVNDCNDLVQNHANGMICNYTGNYWLAYDIKTNQRTCEDRTPGYATQDDCLRMIRTQTPEPQPAPHPQPQPSRLTCQWNGYSYQPHNQGIGFIGLARYGFAYELDCRRTVSMSVKNAVCNWDGVGFKSYDVTTNATLNATSYGSLESCYAQVP